MSFIQKKQQKVLNVCRISVVIVIVTIMLFRNIFLILFLGIYFVNCDNEKTKIDKRGIFRLFLKLFDECNKKGFLKCIKIKTIVFLNRITRENEIFLDDYVSIVKNDKFRVDNNNNNDNITKKIYQEDDLYRRSNEESREKILNDILYESIANFFNDNKIVFYFPKIK